MIPSEYLDLVSGAHTAVLTSVLPDGGPQGSPVWFFFDGTNILVSTRVGLQKHRNIERNPRVAVTIVDPAKPLRYVEVRGVAEITPDPTCTTREAVVRKHGYADGSAFDPPGAQRITITIRPTKVIGH